jgi:hypothetical protein
MSKLVLQFRKNKYRKTYNILKNEFTKLFSKEKINVFKVETKAPIA